MKKLLNMRKISLILFFFLIIIAATWLSSKHVVGVGTTYYMRADGTAAWDVTSGCGLASTAMSVTEHNNNGSFSAGDIIVLCDDGDNYTSTIIPPSSGSSGNNITYQAETGGEPTITGAAYGIRINDKQYLAFSGINISNVTQSGVRVDSTANRSGFTFDDLTISDVWQHAIWFNTTNGFTASNITISDSLIQNWTRATPSWSASSDDSSDGGLLGSAAIRINYADTVSVVRNTLNMTSCARTSSSPKCGDAIDFRNSTNVITEYNNVSTDPSSSFGGGGHGIFHSCSDGVNGCSHAGNITRYNYVHQMGDDCFWNDYSQNNPLYYGNVCINTVDDCFDIRGYSSGLPANYGSGTWVNNTCIDYDSSGINSNQKMSGVFKNNIFIRTVAFNCGPAEKCAIALSDPQETGYPRIADSVF